MRLIGHDRTLVMGILNATDDSFAGDGLADDVTGLSARGLQMIVEGADVLDVGAASSRPGHAEVPLELERSRAGRVIAALAERVALPLSIDSTQAAVVEHCLRLGATVVNDVSTLHDDRLARLAAQMDAELVIVHGDRSARPRAARDAAPDAIVAEVRGDLANACDRAERAGLSRERIMVDPGLGFFKTAAESFALLRDLRELRALAPVVVGPSRKGHLGAVTARPLDARVYATVSAGVCAILAGAEVVRVHDVRAMVDAARVADAVHRGTDAVGPPRVAFIGLGANVGDSRETLRRAVHELRSIGELLAVSALWSTAPRVVAEQPDFLNAAAAVRVAPLAAGALVHRLKEIEARLGRTPGPRYGPRTIDLDLLLYAQSTMVVTDDDVVVPHPRLAERRFALAPLSELAPGEPEPRSGLTVRELLSAVEDQPARVVEQGAWWKTGSS